MNIPAAKMVTDRGINNITSFLINRVSGLSSVEPFLFFASGIIAANIVAAGLNNVPAAIKT
ncbi:hypothetical protein [Ruficoccus sp. ZRK36]|uniref:hypothetical protein n=1 Tax=Ruficoccus sp. ZRK36 TaxID=2866311 RepID=UPI001C736406|nr:hypothetical protein [Ruficoccus sp. ZRK36]QYY36426.1 hypothetical protein K0V07_02900 [Ruficoccus sp. ZRK36]